MKKHTVVIIVAVAVLLVVVSCFGVYLKYKWDESGKNTGSTDVFECVSSDIISYYVEKGDDSGYRLIKEAESWRVENNDVAVIDTKKTDELIQYASRITATGITDKNKLKEFNPTDNLTIRIGISDGSECVINFIAEKDDVCVFNILGDEKLYTMYTSARDVLASELNSLRVADIFGETGVNGEILDYFEYRDYDGSELCVRLKTADEISADDKNRYIMTKPYLRSVDDEKFEQQIEIKIPAIKVAKYVDDFPSDMSLYGLDEGSRAVLSFGKGNMVNTLYLGHNDNGLVYAAKEGQGGVFAVNSSQLEFLQTEPFYIMYGNLLDFDMSGITKMSIKTGEEIYEIINGFSDEKKHRFTINGKETSEKMFKSIIDLTEELSLSSELDNIPQNTEDIVLCIYYAYDTKPVTISLVPAGDKAYAAFINGTAEFAVEKKPVDNLIKKIKDINDDPIKANK